MMNPAHPLAFDRRAFLASAGGGFGALALAHLLAGETTAAPAESSAPGLHHQPKAKRVVQLFMNGGCSQMDTFDYKPELDKQHGKQVDFGIKATVTGTPGPVMKCPFPFKQHGETGRWVSSVLPHLAKCVDDMAFLMACASKSNVHGPASYFQNTGFVLPGFPCMGAWISYALGSLVDNLPTFVVLPDARGLPYNNTGNFSSAFLPASHTGTVIKPSAPQPVPFLRAPEAAKQITPASEAASLSLLEMLNRQHLAERNGDTRLAARIDSLELAAKMQLSAPEALDLARETPATHKLYGLDRPETEGMARNCLLARRLLERGVRFVQVWSGMGGPSRNWDNHNDIPKELPFIAGSADQPMAALIQDLKQRGMLEDTLVVGTTEFGRMPCTQSNVGRDHNQGTFVTWLAGAGIKSGATFGKSDDFAFATAEGTTYVYDLHATILHLLGIDHTRLTFRHDGIDRRLTDVHGHVIKEILKS